MKALQSEGLEVQGISCLGDEKPEEPTGHDDVIKSSSRRSHSPQGWRVGEEVDLSRVQSLLWTLAEQQGCSLRIGRQRHGRSLYTNLIHKVTPRTTYTVSPNSK